MNEYRITAQSGDDYGVYEGKTEQEAFLAMIKDGGRTAPDETTGTADDWTIMEVSDPREYIKELVEWEDVNSYVATDYVEEWCNCRETTITKEGDIWIKDPGAGSWLTDEQLQAFVDWCRSMFGDGLDASDG